MQFSLWGVVFLALLAAVCWWMVQRYQDVAAKREATGDAKNVDEDGWKQLIYSAVAGLRFFDRLEK